MQIRGAEDCWENTSFFFLSVYQWRKTEQELMIKDFNPTCHKGSETFEIHRLFLINTITGGEDRRKSSTEFKADKTKGKLKSFKIIVP